MWHDIYAPQRADHCAWSKQKIVELEKRIKGITDTTASSKKGGTIGGNSGEPLSSQANNNSSTCAQHPAGGASALPSIRTFIMFGPSGCGKVSALRAIFGDEACSVFYAVEHSAHELQSFLMDAVMSRKKGPFANNGAAVLSSADSPKNTETRFFEQEAFTSSSSLRLYIVKELPHVHNRDTGLLFGVLQGYQQSVARAVASESSSRKNSSSMMTNLGRTRNENSNNNNSSKNANVGSSSDNCVARSMLLSQHDNKSNSVTHGSVPSVACADGGGGRVNSVVVFVHTVHDTHSEKANMNNFFPRFLLDNPMVELFRVPPITSQNMCRRLVEICSAEGVDIPYSVLWELSESSNGDMRQALLQLQWHCTGMPSRSRRKRNTEEDAKDEGRRRREANSNAVIIVTDEASEKAVVAKKKDDITATPSSLPSDSQQTAGGGRGRKGKGKQSPVKKPKEDTKSTRKRRRDPLTLPTADMESNNPFLPPQKLLLDDEDGQDEGGAGIGYQAMKLQHARRDEYIDAAHGAARVLTGKYSAAQVMSVLNVPEWKLMDYLCHNMHHYFPSAASVSAAAAAVATGPGNTGMAFGSFPSSNASLPETQNDLGVKTISSLANCQHYLSWADSFLSNSFRFTYRKGNFGDEDASSLSLDAPALHTFSLAYQVYNPNPFIPRTFLALQPSPVMKQPYPVTVDNSFENDVDRGEAGPASFFPETKKVVTSHAMLVREAREELQSYVDATRLRPLVEDVLPFAVQVVLDIPTFSDTTSAKNTGTSCSSTGSKIVGSVGSVGAKFTCNFPSGGEDTFLPLGPLLGWKESEQAHDSAPITTSQKPPMAAPASKGPKRTIFRPGMSQQQQEVAPQPMKRKISEHQVYLLSEYLKNITNRSSFSTMFTSTSAVAGRGGSRSSPRNSGYQWPEHARSPASCSFAIPLRGAHSVRSEAFELRKKCQLGASAGTGISDEGDGKTIGLDVDPIEDV